MPRVGQVLAAALLLAGTTACSAPPADTGPDPVGLDHVIVTPRPDAGGPRVLAVVAHPDDEIAFAGTMYKVATFLGGVVDVALVTNGEGGYKYATLAEDLYGLPLTEEAVGRAQLPAIRRREVVDGGRYMGVHRIFFLGQRDHRYTQDADEILGDGAAVWDLDAVRGDLATILAQGDYDFVLTHGPTDDTHGHHKAATILALQVVETLPSTERPVALGVRWSSNDGPEPSAEPYPGWPISELSGAGPWRFDRSQPFGYKDRLNYKIVVNWAIGAHKSQGTMQLLVNGADHENYFSYALNDAEGEARAAALFDVLARPQFDAPVYADPVSTPAAEAAAND